MMGWVYRVNYFTWQVTVTTHLSCRLV